MPPADEAHFITLWQQGLSHEILAQQLGIPVGTVKSRAHALQQRGLIRPRPCRGIRALPAEVYPGTPTDGERYTGSHRGTPARRHTRVHRRTPALPGQQPTPVHPSTPSPDPTAVLPSAPLPNDAAVRLLSLLPELEVMVARERDRQRLLGTPVGTPRHTVKKT
jgi:DNA-binding transcriptional MocR family regulator